MRTEMEKDRQVTGCCDSCPFSKVCREIFVLREILKDEALYLDDPDLRLRIAEAVKHLEQMQFRYPFANKRCQISEEEEADLSIRKHLQSLLAEVRSVNRVSLDPRDVAPVKL